VLCHVQAACNKYDQHDTHTAVSILQQLSVWRNSCQNSITGVSIAQQLSVLRNSCQYCITAELVTCQGTTCARQKSQTLHQQFKTIDRHQDRQRQKDWGNWPTSVWWVDPVLWRASAECCCHQTAHQTSRQCHAPHMPGLHQIYSTAFCGL